MTIKQNVLSPLEISNFFETMKKIVELGITL